ncbi:MAG TPA: helix-turn-helix transcriptional regulator [Thermoanaerobaculia bacterium]|jgi:transcriptional regulator with XRE-family HTH domain|nr:helix-turn-helix transcriptional regulator [Thermoanaerobaculia bacterium]
MSRARRTAEIIFGEHLRALRVSAGLSQEALAEKSGLHRNYIGHIERGEKTASLDVLVRLSAAFELSLPELLEGFDSRTVRMLSGNR